MNDHDLHQRLVDAAELTGLTQCRRRASGSWTDADGATLVVTSANVPRIASCTELGLLIWGSMVGVITLEERCRLHAILIDNGTRSLSDANDAGMMWQDFTELLS